LDGQSVQSTVLRGIMRCLTEQQKEIIAYILLIALWVCRQIIAANGVYADTDNYTRALRVIEFLQHPTMFEQKFVWADYPFGEISHWTRFPDLVLALLSLPFLLFYPLKQAVFMGGFLLNPLFLFLTFAVCWQIAARLFSFRGRLVFFLFLYAQLHFMQNFSANRPDHHSILIFLAVFSLWQILLFLQSGRDKNLLFLALGTALSLWVSVEGIFLYAVCIACFYLNYLRRLIRYRALCLISAAYSGFVVLFWLVNPPFQGFMYLDNGRISLWHVLISAWVAGSFYLGNYLRTRFVRTSLLFLCAAGLFGLCLYGGFFVSPLSPAIKAAFTDRIAEMASGATVYYLAYPVLALFAAAFMWSSGERSVIFTYVLLNLFVYTGLQIYAMRFTSVSSFYAAFILAMFFNALVCGNIKFFICAVLVYCLDFCAFTLNILLTENPLEIKSKAPLALQIDKKEFPDGAVVTDVFMAPYIIWYAERPTVASPYHRNIEGILDNQRILFSADKEEVVRLIRKHKVGSIYLPDNLDADYYVNPAKNCDKIYGLITGCSDRPEWLIEKSQPQARFFVIDGDKLPQTN